MHFHEATLLYPQCAIINRPHTRTLAMRPVQKALWPHKTGEKEVLMHYKLANWLIARDIGHFYSIGLLNSIYWQGLKISVSILNLKCHIGTALLAVLELFKL